MRTVPAQPNEPKGLSMRWTRLHGVGADVFVGERGPDGFPRLALDRMAVGVLEVGRSRQVTPDGAKEIHPGMSRFLVPGEVVISTPLSPYARFTLVFAPRESESPDASRFDEAAAFDGSAPPVVEARPLAEALLELKRVALEEPGDPLAAQEAWAHVVYAISQAKGQRL